LKPIFSKTLAAFCFAVLLVTGIGASADANSFKTWVLSQKEAFRNQYVKGEPVEDGFEFTLLNERSWLQNATIPFDLSAFPKISASLEVKRVQNAGVGVALKNNKKGFVFEIYPDGKVILNYFEIFPNAKDEYYNLKYWEVWSGNTIVPNFPFSIKLEYQGLPPIIKGYIDDKIIISTNLEKNPVCDPPRTITACGIKISSIDGKIGRKAVFSYLDVEEKN